MKKVVFSIGEKRLIRLMFVLVLVQILIVVAFIRMFNSGQPVRIHDTNQTDIMVEDIYCVSSTREHWLIIIADSEKYLFESQRCDEYSVNELYELISKGDKLSLKYYESYNIFGKVNMVVDARTGTETYRSLEGYNRGKQGLPVFVVILFSIIELAFIGIVLVYVWLNYSVFKGVYRKIKKHHHNRCSNRHSHGADR